MSPFTEADRAAACRRIGRLREVPPQIVERTHAGPRGTVRTREYPEQLARVRVARAAQQQAGAVPVDLPAWETPARVRTIIPDSRR